MYMYMSMSIYIITINLSELIFGLKWDVKIIFFPGGHAPHPLDGDASIKHQHIVSLLTTNPV